MRGSAAPSDVRAARCPAALGAQCLHPMSKLTQGATKPTDLEASATYVTRWLAAVMLTASLLS